MIRGRLLLRFAMTPMGGERFRTNSNVFQRIVLAPPSLKLRQGTVGSNIPPKADQRKTQNFKELFINLKWPHWL